MVDKKILKKAEYKSYTWASQPVIGESFFREYDFRDPIKDMEQGGKTVPASVNEDGYYVLGQAYGSYVQKTLKEKKIVVASDYRSYNRGMAYAFMTGVISTGVDVIDIGVQLTPAIYFAQYHFKLKGGAIITASHNDNGWTGLKLSKDLSRTFEFQDILPFKKFVYQGNFLSGKGSYKRIYDFENIYLKDIVKFIKPKLGKKKLKVVVSGGNGLGGMFLVELLKSLDVTVIPTYNELDWDYPNFNPNPEHVKFLNILSKKVVKEKADLGIGNDGDGDRLGVVDNKGNKVYADRVGLFLARYLVQDLNKKNQKIVVDVKSTGAYALDPVLQKYDTETIFCKTGHSYVKADTQDKNALIGSERSGHFFLRGTYGRGYDDSTLAAGWLIVILSNSKYSMSEMIEQQRKSYQSPTMEPSVKDDKIKYVIVDKVVKYFKELKKNNKPFAGRKIKELILVNGVRFIFDNGSWGLVRASSNLPVLGILAESFESRREMYDIIEALQKYLKQYDLGEYDQELPPYPGEDK